MDALVVDTNIVSYAIRDDTRIELYKPHFFGKTLCLSFMTVAELFEGAERKGWNQRRVEALEAEIGKYLVIPYSMSVCRIWGRIRAERKDRPIAVDDAWIAATALAHDSPIVTHNPDDFTDINGLKIITELKR